MPFPSDNRNKQICERRVILSKFLEGGFPIPSLRFFSTGNGFSLRFFSSSDG